MPPNRLPYFPFYVDDYLNDPAVLSMDADAEGCYCRLLFRSWRSNTPGIIFRGHMYEMAGFWRLADQYRLLWDPKRWVQREYGPDMPSVDEMATERLGEVVAQIEACFTMASDGFMTQKRMVAEYDKLRAKANAQSRAAVTTNKNKAIQQRARRAAKRALTAPLTGVEVEVEVKKEKEKDSDSLLPLSDSDNGDGNDASRVPLAARIVRYSSLKPITTHPDAQAQIEAMRLAGLLPIEPPADEDHFKV